jgi:hypothetical protein
MNTREGGVWVMSSKKLLIFFSLAVKQGKILQCWLNRRVYFMFFIRRMSESGQITHYKKIIENSLPSQSLLAKDLPKLMHPPGTK